MANILGFVVKRLLTSVVVVFLIVTVVFFLAHASPYDPMRLLLGRHVNVLNLERLRAKYGLNHPLFQQYLNYMGGLLHGNFGYSSDINYEGVSVWDILKGGVPVTMKLGIWALALALVVGLPIGLISALRQNSLVDHAGQGVMVLFYVVPSFVLVPVAKLVFGATLHWLPVTGWGDSGWWGPFGYFPNGSSPNGNSFIEMILPITLYAAGLAGFFAKSYRSFVLEVLRQDYIRTARAKGLKNRVVVYLHACKNTLLPLASIVGPTIAFLILGAFIIEVYFSIPGIGYITATAVLNSDYATIEATTLILVVFVVVINMLTDIFYSLVDPRVRL